MLELLAIALPSLVADTTQSVPEPLKLTAEQKTMFDKHEENLIGHPWALRVLKGTFVQVYSVIHSVFFFRQRLV